jgi:hypothetical protein
VYTKSILKNIRFTNTLKNNFRVLNNGIGTTGFLKKFNNFGYLAPILLITVKLGLRRREEIGRGKGGGEAERRSFLDTL